MGVRDRLRRLLDTAAPLACAFCEGGSGTVLDRETGRLAVCPHCNGTGREAYPASAAEAIVEHRLGRSPRAADDPPHDGQP